MEVADQLAVYGFEEKRQPNAPGDDCLLRLRVAVAVVADAVADGAAVAGAVVVTVAAAGAAAGTYWPYSYRLPAW